MIRFGARARRALAVSLVAASLAAYATVQPEKGIGLPRDNSVDGHLIDRLLNETNVVNIVFFSIMCGWILIACFRFNRKHTAVYDAGDKKLSIMVPVFVLALAVTDGNLYVNTLIEVNGTFWNFQKPANDPNTIKIEINAHQWAWNARYAGPDGKFGTDDDIVTWNDVRIPTGAPVYLQLTSTDVIHAFYLPNFRVKSDVVPGQVNRMWFEAKEPGEFEIGCAQHCGVHHYKMKGLLTVLPPDQFKAWVAQASDNSKRAYDPDDQLAHWAWEWKEL